ncbi:hypothetical protein PtB15_12B352 [Puccinia triticina]|nr:hypothetical protein PtB15_12B352 [Puccinia triticina]
MLTNPNANAPGPSPLAASGPNGGPSNSDKDAEWIARLVNQLVPRFQAAGDRMQTDGDGDVLQTSQPISNNPVMHPGVPAHPSSLPFITTTPNQDLPSNPTRSGNPR